MPMNLFMNQIEQEAIIRIQKFSKIAKAMGFEICLGFSDGKDSQVVICRWLNHSFMPFTRKQEELYQKVKAKYDLMYENRITGC